MEQKENQNPPAASAAAQQSEPAPQQTAAQSPTPAPQAPAKSNPWPWIVGGCLLIVILIIGTVMFVGWWGMRAVKKGIQENETTQSIQKNIDKMTKESEEWQKKSEEFRNSMPNPEDFQQDYQSDYPVN